MNHPGHLGVLRRANARLSSFFTRFSGGVVLGAQEELRMLLQVEHTLRSIEVLLQQGLQESADRETREELVTYRANLVRLQRELAVGQDSAMANRARISARQNHLQAARAWLAASRTTQ
jgi:hypothetical protein